MPGEARRSWSGCQALMAEASVDAVPGGSSCYRNRTRSGWRRQEPVPWCSVIGCVWLGSASPAGRPDLCSVGAGTRDEPEAARSGGEAVPGAVVAASVHVADRRSPAAVARHSGAVRAGLRWHCWSAVGTFSRQHRPVTGPFRRK